MKYGNVRIGATGERALEGFPDVAALLYLDGTGATTDYGASLGSGYALYWGDSVPEAVFGGRILHWLAGTTDGNYYRIRSFSVKWVYYVLQ